jgi:hypothetical protein
MAPLKYRYFASGENLLGVQMGRGCSAITKSPGLAGALAWSTAVQAKWEPNLMRTCRSEKPLFQSFCTALEGPRAALFLD